MITTEMHAAISPYSIAVAPFSSWKKLRRFVMLRLLGVLDFELVYLYIGQKFPWSYRRRDVFNFYLRN
jgi:hypothetical protein